MQACLNREELKNKMIRNFREVIVSNSDTTRLMN